MIAYLIGALIGAIIALGVYIVVQKLVLNGKKKEIIAKAEIEAIRDSLKQEMLERGTEELECGQYILRYQTIVTNRFDNSSFKKLMPDVYKSFIRQSTSKRFTVA